MIVPHLQSISLHHHPPLASLKVTLCLATLLVVSQAEDIIDKIDDTIDDAVHTVENKTSQEIDDKLKNFFHDSRNKLYLAFYNLSSYLPLSISYAETVAKDCDILQHNKNYYKIVGIILAAAMAIVGLIFAFLGKLQECCNE